MFIINHTNMFIHWKSLIGFGFIFWTVLCLNDFLRADRSKRYYSSDYDDSYDSPIVEKILEKRYQTLTSNTTKLKEVRFGASLLLWNTLTFIFSLTFCSFARTIWLIIWKVYTYRRNRRIYFEIQKSGNLTEKNSNISKIPVIIRSNSLQLRSSDSDIKVKPKVKTESSCPNLLSARLSSTNCLPRNCRTLFQNNKMFTQTDLNNTFDRHLEKQCVKLREEIVKLQATSLKEHAVLSRKIDAVTKEKRELSKQLVVAQKENRAAKQQLEELLQEKGVMLKRLETAAKEFKCNTKSKKFALAKLEEVTANAENLKQQLEQVSRDKEILESKLHVLEGEYEKLQERLILSQNEENFDNYNEITPERDCCGKGVSLTLEKFPLGDYGDMSFNNVNSKTNPTESDSISQTELDMRKIQIKIQQLEKNLENFNTTKTEIRDLHPEESEISLSVRGNTDSQVRSEDEDTDLSENHYSSSSSPRFKNWGGRAGDLVRRKVQFAKIQALANKMHQKVRFLDNIRENNCNLDPDETLDDYSSREFFEDQPQRIVSSSVAFQNFLKTLHTSENTKRQYGTHSDFYF